MAGQRDRSNVVIFAGAGASRALPETKLPTTIEFFNTLPQRIRENDHFSFVERFIESRESEKIIDIEDILLELQNLIAFFRSANDSSDIVGRAVSSNLIRTVHPNYTFGQLESGGSQLADLLEQLQGRINAQVYRLYSKEPSDEELDATWNPLLRSLVSETYLDIFTTNYDLVIENAFQSVADEATMYKYLGATGRAQKHLDLAQWREDAKRSLGLLTKLHGSLNWKLDDGAILLGDWAFTGDHAKQAIIYPGFKGPSNALFFDPFHEYLARTLARADYVLVIGFAFRDDAINQIFRGSLNPAASITVMDLNKELVVPTRRKPARLSGFNAGTVSEFLETVRR